MPVRVAGSVTNKKILGLIEKLLGITERLVEPVDSNVWRSVTVTVVSGVLD